MIMGRFLLDEVAASVCDLPVMPPTSSYSGAISIAIEVRPIEVEAITDWLGGGV
jgi:predicted RNA binding protein with dsRBD fold (UPF0201 family)